MANGPKKKSKVKVILIGAAVVVVIGGIFAANMLQSEGVDYKVSVGKVERADLTSIVTASGQIQAQTEVKISANVSAKIVNLPVKEGQKVKKGDLLVQLDPDRYQAAVDQYRASLSSQQAQLELSRAQEEEAELAFRRAEKLFSGKLISKEEYDAARTQYDISKARSNSDWHGVERAKASLREARDQFNYTTITSPIDGTITVLNAEIGEIVMIGTMNNPGTVIMTVSDLSAIEVEIEVDETDIAQVEIGQPVKIELDALPDTTFKGEVIEIGNSAQVSGYGSSDQVTNFLVTVLMKEIDPEIRPGMSATCDITTAEAVDVLNIPIGAVVLRDEKDVRKDVGGDKKSPAAKEDDGGAHAADGEAAKAADEKPKSKKKVKPKELQGVFVIKDDVAHFVEVTTGIADQQNIQVKSGLEEGDEIVTGSFKVLRKLAEGDRVEIKKPSKSEKSD